MMEIDMILRSFSRRALLLASVSLCVLPGVVAAQTTSYLRDGDHWVTMGDSITAQGLHQAYMGSILRALYPEANIRIVNQGVGGQTAPGLATAFKDYVAKNKPTIATVMFGVNDTKWNPADPDSKEATFIAGVTKYIETARDANLALLLLRETHFSHDANGSQWLTDINAFLERLLAAQDKLAAANAVPVIDVHNAYIRALQDAWKVDWQYQFTPDVIHPSAPGQAAMATEILRALGAGLPLAEANSRGPLHLDANTPIHMQAQAGRGVVAADGKLSLPIHVANAGPKDLAGQVLVVVNGQKFTLPAAVSAGKDLTLPVDLPISCLRERYDCLPIFMAFVGPDTYTADETVFFYSRVFESQQPFAAEPNDFHRQTGSAKEPCPVSGLTARLDKDKAVVEFTWKDLTPVTAQAPFENARKKQVETLLDFNAFGAQPCDAVELFFDTRDANSLGRYTGEMDTNPPGVWRVGICKVAEGDKLVPKLLLNSDVPAGQVTLRAEDNDHYVVEAKAPNGGPVGFSMRVSDPAKFGLGGRFFYLTGKPATGWEIMSFVQLGNGGIFCRVGY